MTRDPGLQVKPKTQGSRPCPWMRPETQDSRPLESGWDSRPETQDPRRCHDPRHETTEITMGGETRDFKC